MKTACETQHGYRAQWCGLARFGLFLGFQPRKQSARMFVVQLANFFDRHFNGVHEKYNSEKRAFMQHIVPDNE
jgi:hypothetical protein